MQIPTVSNVPTVDTNQMIEVDRAMIEDYEILLIQMMENAGRNLAHLARFRFFNGDPRRKSVVVLAGTGGNGGGGMVAARRLANYGAAVTVVLTSPDEKFTPIPRHQLNILRHMKIDFMSTDELEHLPPPDLILDAIIGYSLKGAPYGTPKTMIEWANRSGSPILSLDAPSGIDTTSGRVFDPAIQATATMTLALPKAGFKTPGVAAQLGELYLADISVPPALYANEALQMTVDSIFAQSDLVRIEE